MNKIDNYAVDPGKPAGPKIEFIFIIESDGPWRRGSAAWIEPAFIRER